MRFTLSVSGAILVLSCLSGCCLDVKAVEVDAGTCRIGDGGVVEAGTWLAADLGSCEICDPSLDPNGWTALAAGQACQGFGSLQIDGPNIIPLGGTCTIVSPSPYVFCHAALPGSPCNGGPYPVACSGGFCNDGGFCEVDQNIGWGSNCGYVDPDGFAPTSSCAQGPCCMDAGSNPIVPVGDGWCCGLVDGGVKTCLGARGVCYQSSDCCEGLTCVGQAAVYDGDAGYGFCE